MRKRKSPRMLREERDAGLARATALVKQDHYREALRVLAKVPEVPRSVERWRAMDDDNAEQMRHNLLGLCHEHAGDLAAARAEFRIAWKLGAAQAGLNLARLAVQTGTQLARARKLLDDMPCVDDDVRYHNLNYSAQIAVLRGDAALAREHYQLLVDGWRRDRARLGAAREELVELLPRQAKAGVGETVLDLLEPRRRRR